jgi:hypothetical protein
MAAAGNGRAHGGAAAIEGVIADLERDTGIGAGRDPDQSIAELRAAAEERAAAEAQAAVEGVALADKVELKGQWFRISEAVGLMPLMKFAAAADSDLDTSDMDGLAALYNMLRDCIYPGEPCSCGAGDDSTTHKKSCTFEPGDWKAFERHATAVKADADDLLPVVGAVIQKLTARPTRPGGSSSAGSPPTSARSTGSYSKRRAAASRR